MQRRKLIRLTLMLRPIIKMPKSRMTQLVREHVPLRTRPQVRVDEDSAAIRQPQSVSRPQGPHEHIHTELFCVLPRIV